MALPKIETPRYTTVLPSGMKVDYRPFFVREQKIILQAMEMGDESQLNNAIEDVLKACTFGELDLDSLPVYDVEYLLLMIRASSVGESVEMYYKCNNIVEDDGNHHKCGTRIPVTINLMDVEVVESENRNKTINLSNSIGFIMRDLPYGVYKKMVGKKIVEASIPTIASCIESVFDESTVYSREDFTDDELVDFIEKLTTDDFKKLEDYIDSMPKLELKVKMKCPKCKAEDEITLSGIDDFLA